MTCAAVAVAWSSAPAAVSAHHEVPAIRMTASPRISRVQTLHPWKSRLFDCQSAPLGSGLRCYSPQQIQQAYGFAGLLAAHVDGKGQTIVIVDAFHDPYLKKDLELQDKTFKLPDAHLQVVAPQGVPAFDPNDENMDGWVFETTLDVLWAHAMAPGAKILLVESKTDSDVDMLAATQWAVDKDAGDVISQSFGEAEQCASASLIAQQHAIFQKAVAEGITLVAATGDSGAAQFNCDGTAPILAVGTPASDPLVTSVGGTTLSADDPTGNYLGETAWTEPLYLCNPPDADDTGCSGGGFSRIWGTPAYQHGLGPTRGVPDVSINAGSDGGYLIHCGLCNVLFDNAKPDDPKIFFTIGGTSAGSPQWAALAADAQQLAGHPLGNINPTLYGLAGNPATYAADFHDITTGTNRVAALGGKGYDARTGWDPVTGLGSPNAANLVPALGASCWTGTIRGPLEIRSGQPLCILPGTIITGPLKISGAPSVNITGATITGPVTISECGDVEFDNNTVNGPLTFKHNASVHQSGNVVSGPVKIS
jgi:subtilase family serine protease